MLFYYEMLLNLVLNYDVWYDWWVVDFFGCYVWIVIDYLYDYVKYWILINEIDSIIRYLFLLVGLVVDCFVSYDFKMVIY